MLNRLNCKGRFSPLAFPLEEGRQNDTRSSPRTGGPIWHADPPSGRGILLLALVIPLMLWIAFTPFSPWLDLTVSAFFYSEGAFAAHPFWDRVYVYGLWPAWLMMGSAGAGLILSFFGQFKSWRKPCLYLMLTFGIGSGLIIEVGFKHHWSRPRPRQVVDFGGTELFRPYYRPVRPSPQPARSFPSGHAAAGFCFFALMVLGKRRCCPIFFWGGLALAVGLGGLLSLARIAQGGHFLSDTLAAAFIMWSTAWFLAPLLWVPEQVE